MINSKQDLREYIAADRIANHFPKYYNSLFLCRLGGGYNALYLWYLRNLEYWLNCHKGGGNFETRIKVVV